MHIVMWVDYVPADVEIDDEKMGKTEYRENDLLPVGLIAQLVEHYTGVTDLG